MKRATILLAATLLAGCGGSNDEDEVPIPKAARPEKAQSVDSAVAERVGATPNKDRVATLGLLNKRNNLTQDLVLKTGQSRRVGNVVVKLESCERTFPWETPRETGAFVQVFVYERPSPGKDARWRKVFSGWLFKNDPSLNVVEHPVYDVWVKDCAMKFPGDEAKPAAAASPSSAPKATGSASAAPTPSPGPSPETGH